MARPFHDMRKRVVPQAKGVVVEIGFGSGLNLRHYDPTKVIEIVAVDPDARALAVGLKRSEGTAHTLHTLTARGERVPLPDGYADTVVITYALCTIPNPKAALSEARRILRVGGELHFAEHGRDGPAWDTGWRRRANLTWGVLAGGCHLDRNSLALIRDAGFDLSSATREDFPAFFRHLGWHYSGIAVKSDAEAARNGSGWLG